MPIELLSNGWADRLAELIAGAKHELAVCSPYITRPGIELLISRLKPTRQDLQITVLTDLSPENLADGSTDPSALKALVSTAPGICITHLPRVHAKVYVRDCRCAIVTSGNLTHNGLLRNFEYGVQLNDPADAKKIASDLAGLQAIASPIALNDLEYLCESTVRLQQIRAKMQHAADQVGHSFNTVAEEVRTQLMKLRLREGPLHSVFAATIDLLLRQQGPLTTKELHERTSAIHPDLCDDSVDRVIDGRSFGKKWKHALRSAQQHLKKQGRIMLANGRWTLVES